MQHRFRKAERLKSRKTIQALFSQRQSVASFPLRLLWQYEPVAIAGRAPVQVAFSVPKRKVKKAVDRHRLQRLMREAYRLEKGVLSLAQGQLSLLFLYADTAELPLPALRDKARYLLSKVGQIALGPSPAQTVAEEQPSDQPPKAEHKAEDKA
jgi:ribonuclease P protein component